MNYHDLSEGHESCEVDDNEEWLRKINEEIETGFGEGSGFSFACNFLISVDFHVL